MYPNSSSPLHALCPQELAGQPTICWITPRGYSFARGAGVVVLVVLVSVVVVMDVTVDVVVVVIVAVDVVVEVVMVVVVVEVHPSHKVVVVVVSVIHGISTSSRTSYATLKSPWYLFFLKKKEFITVMQTMT